MINASAKPVNAANVVFSSWSAEGIVKPTSLPPELGVRRLIDAEAAPPRSHERSRRTKWKVSMWQKSSEETQQI